MENDRRKIELMNSIRLSMPGTPIIYYGDEIGWATIFISVTAMACAPPCKWTPDRNGGFSRCDPAQISCRRS